MTDQFDLFGGMAGAKREGELRWAEADGSGRLGWAPQSLTPEAAKAAKVGVVLLVSDDASAAAEAFGAAGLDVRVLSSVAHADHERHRDALAADRHAGRSTVVVAQELSDAAFLVALGLIESGVSPDAATAACGGEAALGDRAAELAALAPNAEAPPTPEKAAKPAPIAEPTPEAEPEPAEAASAEAPPEPAPLDSPLDGPPPPLLDEPLEAPSDEAFQSGGELFDEPPTAVTPAPVMRASSTGLGPFRSRLVGAVLGGAIGDAMGHPTEFISSFESIRARFGPDGVQGYELWREEGERRFAPYTDDTQMAECVLRALLAGRAGGWGLDRTMRDMAQRFVQWSKKPQGGHRAPGNACLAGCRALDRGAHWSEAGGEKAGGCGSVMRAFPFGLMFHDDLARAERWAVEHSKLTHRDPIALAASAAMAIGVARVTRGEGTRQVLSEMVAAACRYSPRTAEMMAKALDEAERGVEPEVTLTRLEGWAAHEAIAAAVYLYARHADDPRAAILEGANTPGDSDSLATLVGALCGARGGLEGLPADWVRDVERTDELTALALDIDR